MFRFMLPSTAALLLLVSAAASFQGDSDAILDKKDKLTEKDAGFQTSNKMLTVIVGHPCKVFTLKFKKGEELVLQLKSKDFDALLIVEDSAKKVLAFNDDDPAGGASLDSKLVWKVPADGEYRVIATSVNNKVGDFQLLITKGK